MEKEQNEADNGKKKSFIINIRNGLFTARHRIQMGSAIWEFGLLLDWVTKENIDEDGVCWGKVRGGIPIKIKDMASLLGEHANTCFKNLSTLEDFGYIRRKRAPYGFIIEVKNTWKFHDRDSQESVTLSPDSQETVSPESQKKKRESQKKKQDSQESVTVIKTEHDRTKTEQNIMSEVKPSDATKGAVKYPEDSQPYKDAVWFWELIKPNMIRKKQPLLQTWAKDCDWIVRIDEIDPELFREVAEWVAQDDFESANVLSPSKLRKRFDDLAAKMKRSKRRAGEDEEEWFPIGSPERIEQDRRKGL